MLKKALPKVLTLAVMATLGTSVSAANVNIYGVIDGGINVEKTAGITSTSLASGNYAGPRLGFKGTESIGDGLEVGFILEAGYSMDTGALGASNTLFNRESLLSLKSDFGTISMGRMGSFASASGSQGWFWDMDAFDGGYFDAGIQATQAGYWDRFDNGVSYVTPTFGGLKIAAMYAGVGDDTIAAGGSGNFSNIALRYDNDNMAFMVTAESQNRVGEDNTERFKVAGKYKFTDFTLFAGVALTENETRYADATWNVDWDNWDKSVDALSMHIGTQIPMGNGTLMAQVQYQDGDVNETDDFKRYAVGLGYHYFLSNNTMLYTVVSHAKGDGALEKAGMEGDKRTALHLGMTHYF